MTRPDSGPNGHVFIVSAARTPIGKFGGALSGTPAVALGGVAIRAAVERAGLEPETATIDEVLMGQVLQAGVGQAPPSPAAWSPGTGSTFGTSGARIVATLTHELQRRKGRYGLATLCLGGGGSVAMAIERV